MNWNDSTLIKVLNIKFELINDIELEFLEDFYNLLKLGHPNNL